MLLGPGVRELQMLQMRKTDGVAVAGLGFGTHFIYVGCATRNEVCWKPLPGCNRAEAGVPGNFRTEHTLWRDASWSLFRAHPLSQTRTVA
jgi:hypothetical protein